MYQDLMEHFPAILALLGVFATATCYLTIRAFNDMKAEIKSLNNKFEIFLTNVVTRPECDQKHDNLITLFTAMMNCHTCGRKDEVQR